MTKSYADSNNTIAEMGGLAEGQLGAAIEAVATRDNELAARVVEGDVRSTSSNGMWTISLSGSWRCASRWRAICARFSPR